MAKVSDTEKAHIEIEALIQYITDLKELNKLLTENFEDAKNNINQVSQTWFDPTFIAFKEEFDKTYPKINIIGEFSRKAALSMTKKWLPNIQEYIALKNKVKK